MMSQSSVGAFPPMFDFTALANHKKLSASPVSTTQQQTPLQAQQQTTKSTFTLPSQRKPMIPPLSSHGTSADRMPLVADSIPEEDDDSTTSASTTQKRASYSSGSSERSSSRSSGSSSSSSKSSYGSRTTKSSRSRSSRSSKSGVFRDKHDVQMENLRDRPMTEEEYRMKQIDLIMALRQMKADGIPVDESVELSQSTPLAKLQFAHDYAYRYVLRKATFEQFQQYLTLGTQFLEMGNTLVKQKTGVGAELDGWGASVMLNMPRFNRPLQRLAQKYTGTSESSPEVELAMLVGYSAVSFHFAKKYSLDPQLAMQFADFLSAQDRAALESAAPVATGGSGAQRMQPGIPVGGLRPTEAPFGMRPPAPQQGRTGPRVDNESDVESSEETEEVQV